MSRTYHATGTGSFTRAGEVRRDRSALRQFNQDPANRGNQKAIPIHGATSDNPEGKLTYEQAQKLIKNGDKIVTPDGEYHIVNAQNRDELIGRLGATVYIPAANEGRAKAGSNIIPRGTTKTYSGNAKNAKFDKNGRVQVKGSGARGKAQRITSEQQRLINKALPFNVLQGIGQGTNKINKGEGIGFQKVGPTSTYKPSGNAKNTAIKGGASKANQKLSTRLSKTGSFRPKSTRAQMTKAYAARRAAGAKQRAADKKAGIVKPTQKRGPRAPLPKGTIRGTGKLKGVNGARINAPRKGGRGGKGRSR
jgi:hypothetical protein